MTKKIIRLKPAIDFLFFMSDSSSLALNDQSILRHCPYTMGRVYRAHGIWRLFSLDKLWLRSVDQLRAFIVATEPLLYGVTNDREQMIVIPFIGCHD